MKKGVGERKGNKRGRKVVRKGKEGMREKVYSRERERKDGSVGYLRSPLFRIFEIKTPRELPRIFETPERGSHSPQTRVFCAQKMSVTLPSTPLVYL